MLPAKRVRVKYTPDRCDQVFRISLLGHTEKVIAGAMLVSYETFNKWKVVYPDFAMALNEGKAEADSHVVAGLYKKACGYDEWEEKAFMYKGEIVVKKILKHIPPDAWAAMKWLQLRQREHWSDVQKLEITNNQNINLTAIDYTKFSFEELLLMKKIGLSQKEVDAKYIGEN